MTVRIVLFEDPTALGMRPLSASTPQFEIRCGMFNLRERVELAGGTEGTVRLRSELQPLVDGGAWSLADDAEAADPRLWLAGRLAPSCDLVRRVLAADGVFVVRDSRGILAGRIDGPIAGAWEQSWQDMARDSWASTTSAWEPIVPEDWDVVAKGPGGTVHAPTPFAAAADLVSVGALDWIWDVVPRTSTALMEDLAAVQGRQWLRRPWALFAADGSAWEASGGVGPVASLPAGVHVTCPEQLHLGSDVVLAPGAVIDASSGPVILERGVVVGPHTLLEGPLYLGWGTRVKAGARIYGESSFGVGNRLAGEIGESTFGDFTNKQHEGFIGHGVLGSWINLGAMTTNSDLKNNYGPVRVDLGEGAVDTGQRFVGLLAGDHVKTAIGTLFNTGTVAGFASNVFGGGMPPKRVTAFSWGGGHEAPAYDVQRAIATATTVMARRDCVFTPGHDALFRFLADA